MVQTARLSWDLAFLAFGVLLVLGGWLLHRSDSEHYGVMLARNDGAIEMFRSSETSAWASAAGVVTAEPTIVASS